jgi:hypothetical protein
MNEQAPPPLPLPWADPPDEFKFVGTVVHPKQPPQEEIPAATQE